MISSHVGHVGHDLLIVTTFYSFFSLPSPLARRM